MKNHYNFFTQYHSMLSYRLNIKVRCEMRNMLNSTKCKKAIIFETRTQSVSVSNILKPARCKETKIDT